MRLTARAVPFLIPIGMAALATSALAGPGRGPSPPAAGGKAGPGPEPVQENPAERKAVRGAPLDESDANESP